MPKPSNALPATNKQDKICYYSVELGGFLELAYHGFYNKKCLNVGAAAGDDFTARLAKATAAEFALSRSLPYRLSATAAGGEVGDGAAGATPIHIAGQVHGNRVLVVDRFSDPTATRATAADGIVSKDSGVVIGIKTADCAPILFLDPVARVIGAAHAGWRGAFGGIIAATVAAMVEIGAQAEKLISVIGPTIVQRSYEVDAQMRQQFIEAGATNSRFFIPVSGEHGGDTVSGDPAEKKYLFDLPAYCADRLKEAGVKQVSTLGIDTYTDPDMSSYRRATHNHDEAAARDERQLSWIMLV